MSARIACGKRSGPVPTWSMASMMSPEELDRIRPVLASQSIGTVVRPVKCGSVRVYNWCTCRIVLSAEIGPFGSKAYPSILAPPAHCPGNRFPKPLMTDPMTVLCDQGQLAEAMRTNRLGSVPKASSISASSCIGMALVSRRYVPFRMERSEEASQIPSI